MLVIDKDYNVFKVESLSSNQGTYLGNLFAHQHSNTLESQGKLFDIGHFEPLTLSRVREALDNLTEVCKGVAETEHFLLGLLGLNLCCEDAQ